MSEGNEKPQEGGDAPVPQAAQQQGQDQRRRLRELMSIPESQRSDAVWDEIIEIEIQLAPGNRTGGAPPKGGGPAQGKGQGPGQGSANWKRHNPARKHAKPGGKKPQSGPGGGSVG